VALQFVTADRLPEVEVHPVLGGACLGLARPSPTPWPLQWLPASLLGIDQPQLHEAWLSDAACQTGHSEGIHWCRSADVLYGVIEIAESESPDVSGACSLEADSEAAYSRIFRLLDSQGLPHLWRAWNYMAHIHGDDAGLERYRRFNKGRGQAFENAARSVVGLVPAACAIGLAQGPLSVAFLAGTVPALPIENPRQVSAYRYPADYGPRSPTFSRAALVYPPGQEWLFVSGTASIVGHRSVHEGDVTAQAHESLNNIEAVLAEANRASRHGAFTLVELTYRVYVRHAADFEAVHQVMQQRCLDAPAVYLLADICRSELLVEIEAMAGHSA
jgi:chorismate lyase/3-hydroxybenzoate synthase